MSNPQEHKETPRERLLTQQQPSHAAGIADACVIKDSGLYFLCNGDGGVPIAPGHGLGLYFRDCRFLSGYELTVAGVQLEPLAANTSDGFRGIFQLTNPSIEPSGRWIDRQRLGVRWRHVLDAEVHTLRDELTIENYDTQAHAFPVRLTFDADFRDVFVIRGLVDERPGTPEPPRWESDELVFSYPGGDKKVRQLRIRFSEPPSDRHNGAVGYNVRLDSHETWSVVVSLSVLESDEPIQRPDPDPAEPSSELERTERLFEQSLDEWMHGFARVRSSTQWVERAVDRSLRDMRALRMSLNGESFFAAGVPWFTTLFGRDSIICALQTLAYRPEIAKETLLLLAHLQGQRVNVDNDEEPGKILHELRVGELAAMGQIPYTPYYGTVDATPLFLILMDEYVRWTGDLSLFRQIRDAVERALEWMERWGDHDGDGYLDYKAEAGNHLINQGWKDSGACIVDAQGRVAEPPIALSEVQGYMFLARLKMAELFQLTGEKGRADILRREAAELHERFNRDFWLESKQFYALALQHGGRVADAVSSNPGHALWAGIIDEGRVEAVVDRLMAPDMYSGWGVRTLSSKERAFNPVGYHLGSVWPHDNAFIVAALRRYGYDHYACQIFSDLLEASTYFQENRLPEVFAGYARGEYGVPVRYPIACHPQAWASGSIPFMLQVLLGLEPDGFDKRLRVVRPCLPVFIKQLKVCSVRINAGSADLVFERDADGALSTRIARVDGELEVQIE